MQARLAASPRKQKTCGVGTQVTNDCCCIGSRCVRRHRNSAVTVNGATNRRHLSQLWEVAKLDIPDLMTLNNFFACVMSCFIRRCPKDQQMDVGLERVTVDMIIARSTSTASVCTFPWLAAREWLDTWDRSVEDIPLLDDLQTKVVWQEPPHWCCTKHWHRHDSEMAKQFSDRISSTSEVSAFLQLQILREATNRITRRIDIFCVLGSGVHALGPLP